MTGAQTLAAIARQQPVAATKPSPPVANAFGETLRTINDDVSIIEASPCRSRRLAFFAKSTRAEAWSSTSPARTRYHLTMMTKNEAA
uniref:Uncharacterized protein n=1 Tax=Romanomermis culicivorax TaxID=13658 RepID=A0A915K0S6_ROMCU